MIDRCRNEQPLGWVAIPLLTAILVSPASPSYCGMEFHDGDVSESLFGDPAFGGCLILHLTRDKIDDIASYVLSLRQK